MAKIVLGVAASRSPLAAMPVELWPAMGESDRRSPWLLEPDGTRRTFDELVAKAPADIQQRLNPSLWQRQHDAAQRAVQSLAQTVAEVQPDTVIILGDDEYELFPQGETPQVAVYSGGTVLNLPRIPSPTAGPIAQASSWQWGDHESTHPVAVDLADAVIVEFNKLGYAVTVLDTLPPATGISHSVGYVFQRLMSPSDTTTPVVPLLINIHYPPNQPKPQEFYELGRAVRRAVEQMPDDRRVAVAGAGGLSTGIVQEDLDHRIIAALRDHDVAAIAALPAAGIQGPCGEIYNWVSVAGASEHLTMDLLDYLPVYRSPAATGCGLAYARWR